MFPFSVICSLSNSMLARSEAIPAGPGAPHRLRWDLAYRISSLLAQAFAATTATAVRGDCTGSAWVGWPTHSGCSQTSGRCELLNDY